MTEQQEIRELEAIYTLPAQAEEAKDFFGLLMILGIMAIVALLLV